MINWLSVLLCAGREKRRRRGLPLSLGAALLVVLASSSALAASKAAAFGWPVVGDTAVPYSTFFGSPHTIAFRFMPQYPTAYEGPIVTTQEADGGMTPTFSIGQGDYRATPNGAKITLKINGQSWNYTPPGLAAGVWAHVAVVRTYSAMYGITSFRLYWNGAALTPYGLGGPTISFGSVTTPAGNIRMGRSVTSETGVDQYYGLLDDLAIFSKALSDTEVANLANNVLQLTGNETGLLWGFKFDSPTPPTGPLSGAVDWTNYPLSPLVVVSTTRSSVDDANMLPLPNFFYAQNMVLPFKPGQAWSVSQYFGGSVSHNGHAAFSLDFRLKGAETPGKDLWDWETEPSCGEPLFAAQGGTFEVDGDSNLSTAIDSGDMSKPDATKDYSNEVRIVQQPYARSVYLHLQTLSVRAMYPGVSVGVDGPLLSAMGVTQLRQIGRVGNGNGCHLHHSVNNAGHTSPTQTTYPFAYYDYEACDAQNGADCSLSASWYSVHYGIPKEGQWVRNPL